MNLRQHDFLSDLLTESASNGQREGWAEWLVFASGDLAALEPDIFAGSKTAPVKLFASTDQQQPRRLAEHGFWSAMDEG
jgi:hypothetical protein